jgi:hypothetical protein
MTGHIARAGRAAVGLPGLPATAGVAAGSRRHAAQVVQGPAVLGADRFSAGETRNRPSPRPHGVIVCLGGFAWNALRPVLGDRGYRVPRPRPAFGHGAEMTVGSGADGGNTPGADDHDGARLLIPSCYHPSQQNTFTGCVTPDMIDVIFTRARDAAGLPDGASGLEIDLA